MVSHRSGETEDTFIADLVVGLCTGQVSVCTWNGPPLATWLPSFIEQKPFYSKKQMILMTSEAQGFPSIAIQEATSSVIVAMAKHTDALSQ